MFRCILLVLCFVTLASCGLCGAPLPVFKPGKGELVQVISFLRHGHRAPHIKVPGLNQCRYRKGENQYSLLNRWSKPCGKEELTKKGADQARKIGERFREVYVKMHKFLPRKFKPSKFQVDWDRSSRTQDTAKYFFKGLYDEDALDELEGKEQPHLHFSDEILACPKLETLLRKRVVSELQKSHGSYFEPLRRLLVDPAKSNRIKGLDKCPFKTFADTAVGVVEAMYCNPITPEILAKNIEKKPLKEALVDGKFTVYRIFSPKSPDLDKYFLTENNRNVQARLIAAANGDAPKMVLYSTHDTTILSWIRMLDIQQQTGKWIGYGSTLIFELWRCSMGKYWVRAMFNGKAIKIPGLDEEFVCLDSFLNHLKSLEASRWAEECTADAPRRLLSLNKLLKAECKGNKADLFEGVVSDDDDTLDL